MWKRDDEEKEEMDENVGRKELRRKGESERE